jgi:hypothetical protein
MSAASLPVRGWRTRAETGGGESDHRPVANRAPLVPGSFTALPLGSIKPAGWLRSQLQIQADGLGGHLDETWADVGPNSGWLGGTGESWERGPYFLDGLVPLAYLLDDPRLKAKAQKYIDWTLENQQPNGMIGPRSNDDWWPRMVMLKVLTQYEEVTGDPRVISLMTRYFEYQLTALPARPLTEWGKYRWQDEVVSVIWLYNRTGNPKLLELAQLLRKQGYDWQAQFADFKYTEPCTRELLNLGKPDEKHEMAMQTHGVNNAMGLKTSPVWFQVSGADEDRRALLRQLAALDKYHGMPTGIFSADEHLAGPNPSQGTELCTVVEAMYSLEQALGVMGDAALGDRLEMIAYNCLPGTFTDDMWAHQYNQQPNQVECSLHWKPWTTDGPESNLYGLEPNFGCCTANFHQGWPKLTSSLWMSSREGGLAAAVYAPCEVRTVVRGVNVKITEATGYPFRGRIELMVSPERAISFPLHLRIPDWANEARLEVNGTAVSTKPGSFAVVEREWKAGDHVLLDLPLAVRTRRGYHDAATVYRGPLVFSLDIGQDWLKLRDRGMTADWQVYPSSEWNYAISGDDVRQIEVAESEIGSSPFAQKETPVRLRAKGRRLSGWRAVDGVADPVPASPVSTDSKEETLTLVPYGAAKLRITAFPVIQI